MARRTPIGVLALVALAPSLARPAPIVVGPADGTCPGALFGTVQSALDTASPRGTVIVCAGTYAEQLVITKPVRLTGQPGARIAPTRLDPLASSLRSGRPVAAVVTLRAPATIEGFAIDASAHGVMQCDGTEPLLAGIFVRGVIATVRGTTVSGAVLPGFGNGCANGTGILVQGSSASPRIRLEGNAIDRYQRAGIVLTQGSLRAFVRENLVTGDGEESGPTQVGIEIDTGVTAYIQDNAVRDNRGSLAPLCAPGTGIVVQGSHSRLVGNQLTGNDVGLHLLGRSHRVTANSVDGDSPGLVGVHLEADESRVVDTVVRRHGGSGLLVAGNRNRLLRTSASAIRASSECTGAPCPGLLGRCGVALWLTGRANRVDRSVLSDTDTPVADDGRANIVR